MANTTGTKSSAELEREAQAQRDRIEARIGEIKDRLSPGQLVDEVLSYTKDGGGKFVSNLGAQVSANPIPAALIGIGLAWLMTSKTVPTPQQSAGDWMRDDIYDEYPYARVPSGGLRRVSHAADDAGQWWSEFETDTGSTYRAASDSLGRRAGHFTDEAGKTFAGFIDDAGNRVRQFQDESGNALDETMGWARHSWRQAQRTVGQQLSSASTAMSQAVDGMRGNVAGMGSSMQSQADQVSRQVMALFEQQPLVAGALAFAAGAALGASLPATKQEDQLLGDQSDKLKQQAVDAAGQAYAEGKRQVAQAYDEVSDRAAELYGDAKDKLSRPPASDKTMH